MNKKLLIPCFLIFLLLFSAILYNIGHMRGLVRGYYAHDLLDKDLCSLVEGYKDNEGWCWIGKINGPYVHKIKCDWGYYKVSLNYKELKIKDKISLYSLGCKGVN